MDSTSDWIQHDELNSERFKLMNWTGDLVQLYEQVINSAWLLKQVNNSTWWTELVSEFVVMDWTSKSISLMSWTCNIMDGPNELINLVFWTSVCCQTDELNCR